MITHYGDKRGRMRWVGHVVRMRIKRNAYKILAVEVKMEETTRKTKKYVDG
jgi:hypothetical protein